jgi:hypothetical protein
MTRRCLVFLKFHFKIQYLLGGRKKIDEETYLVKAAFWKEMEKVSIY